MFKHPVQILYYQEMLCNVYKLQFWHLHELLNCHLCIWLPLKFCNPSILVSPVPWYIWKGITHVQKTFFIKHLLKSFGQAKVYQSAFIMLTYIDLNEKVVVQDFCVWIEYNYWWNAFWFQNLFTEIFGSFVTIIKMTFQKQN